jgi:hypothetical protein
VSKRKAVPDTPESVNPHAQRKKEHMTEAVPSLSAKRKRASAVRSDPKDNAFFLPILSERMPAGTPMAKIVVK